MLLEIYRNKFIEIVEVSNNQPLLNMGRWKIPILYNPPEFYIPKNNLDKQTIMYLDDLFYNNKKMDDVRTYVNHFSGNKTITNHKTIVGGIIHYSSDENYILRCSYYT